MLQVSPNVKIQVVKDQKWMSTKGLIMLDGYKGGWMDGYRRMDGLVQISKF